MTKVAFSVSENRIAPVFDVARQIHLLESETGRPVLETHETIAHELPVQKALCLAELGVSTLVCGAISKPLQEIIVSYDIRVIPFVAGDLSQVVQAWLSGNLEQDSFAMPGCCGLGRAGGRGNQGRSRGGQGRGRGGQGQGRGGQGQGRVYKGDFLPGSKEPT